MSNISKTYRIIAIGIIIVCLIGLYIFMSRSGFLSFIANGDELRLWIIELGALGPVIVVTLMAIAIVMSPLPSAPIALASGAAYGHIEGAIYVLLGCAVCAIPAFYIALLTGLDVINHWMGGRLSKTLVGSQNTLMFIVFVSRLLPFVSFDVISYAAGLTSLSFWRFAIATLAGIIPASLLLAHFGSELMSANTNSIMIGLFLLGIIMLIPILLKLTKNNKARHK